MPTKKELEARIAELEVDQVLDSKGRQGVHESIEALKRDLDQNKVVAVCLAWATYDKPQGLFKSAWSSRIFNDLYGLVTRLWREFDNVIEEDTK